MAKTAARKGATKAGFKKGNSSTNPDRNIEDVKLNGASHARDKTTIKRLKMYKSGKAKRNRHGKIVKEAMYQSKLPSGTNARVAPNQKWFGNVKVIGQTALQNFQTEMKKVINDPYQVVLRKTKLPITLLNESAKQARVHILDTEPYESVFGKKQTRKRPSLKVSSFEEYGQQAREKVESYDPEKDKSLVQAEADSSDIQRAWFLRAGQSKRIWNEFYKIIDSADVVLQVLDARDPMGTRSTLIEKYLKNEKPHKHLIFILNKVDLVPIWVTQKWVAILSQEHPTLAFHASQTNAFGKGALISLLRQLGKLHSDKSSISVGLVGFPNVGKSSIINTLLKKKACNVAPIAGCTKVWQFVRLMKKINLIDGPGTVPPCNESQSQMVLKAAVRTEYLESPLDPVVDILAKVRHDYLRKTYMVDGWTTPEDFVEKIARKSGKLLRGGEPDVNAIARQILNDWQRGRIPYFTPPPNHDTKEFLLQKQQENEETERHIAEQQAAENAELQKVGRVLDDFGEIKNPTGLAVPQDFRGIQLSVQYDAQDTKDLEEFAMPEVQEDEESDTEEAADEIEPQGATSEVVAQETADETRTQEETSEIENKEVEVTSCEMGTEKLDVEASESTEKTENKENSKNDKEVEANHDGGDHDIEKEILDYDSDSDREIEGEDMLSSDEELKEVRKVHAVTEYRKEVDVKPPKSLSSKERRRMERNQRPKKIGVHFYDEVDVKNKRGPNALKSKASKPYKRPRHK